MRVVIAKAIRHRDRKVFPKKGRYEKAASVSPASFTFKADWGCRIRLVTMTRPLKRHMTTVSQNTAVMDT